MKRLILYLPLVFVFLTLAGCGGGTSSGGGVNPPPAADFSIFVSPASLSATAGTTVAFSVSANGTSSSFTGTVSVQITGLPAGVAASPATFTLMSGSTQKVSLAVASYASAGNASLQIAGTSGTLAHSAQLLLTVAAPASPGVSVGRTHYLRTDSASIYEGFTSQQYTVFDPVNGRFFVADPFSNRITVFDAATQAFLGSVPVPGAFGLDETPDHSVLYSGTQLGDVYAIDPATMKVTKRYVAAQIGATGFEAYSVRVLADGRLALLGGQGGIPGVDGYNGVAVWDPKANTTDLYATSYGGGGFGSPGVNVICGTLLNIGGFTLTGDRTHIILGSVDSDATICSIDPVAKTSVYNNTPGFFYNNAATPDGKYIVTESGGNGNEAAYVLDASTLAPVRNFPINTVFDSGGAFRVSADSSTLYLTNDSFLVAYNLATGTMSGWLPNIFLTDNFSGTGVNVGAEDGTGLLMGPMSEGVGFLDTQALRTGTLATATLNGYATPATGPVAGGTQIQINGNPGVALAGTTIGGQAANANTQGGLTLATTPAGTAGPADIYNYFKDGGVQILPEAFSYGPTLLQSLPNAIAAGGQTSGVVFGYGFGSTEYNAPIPSDLKITVGGQSATITKFYPSAYDDDSPPFLLQAATYTVPVSSPGTLDVTVATGFGSTTETGAVQVLPALKQYPLPGAALEEGVYDPHTDLYYFTDATQIQVFSKTSGAWQSPIPIAPPAGTTAERLWAIALSPDGSKMAVGDVGSAAIYVFNPANPAAVQTFPLTPELSGIIIAPGGLAVSDSGIVYFTQATYGGTGLHGFYKLDSSTGAITDYNIDAPGLGYSDEYLRAAISSDNSTVFFNNDGQPFTIDAASSKITYAGISPGCCYGDYDLSLSSDQTSFAATGYFYNNGLNAESYLSSGVYLSLIAQYVYGEKLSPDGRLLFQPSINGIDIYDGKLGTILQSLQFPFELSQGFDALVSDGRDNVLIAITGSTGTGIAEVDLSSFPEPAPLPYNAEERMTAGRTSLSSKPARSKHGMLRRPIPHASAAIVVRK